MDQGMTKARKSSERGGNLGLRGVEHMKLRNVEATEYDKTTYEENQRKWSKRDQGRQLNEGI